MNKFAKYTDEQLKHWIWMWENCSPTRILYNTDVYKEAIEELSNR